MRLEQEQKGCICKQRGKALLGYFKCRHINSLHNAASGLALVRRQRECLSPSSQSHQCWPVTLSTLHQLLHQGQEAGLSLAMGKGEVVPPSPMLTLGQVASKIIRFL